MSGPKEECRAHFQGSISDAICWNGADQVSPRVLWKGRPAGATTTQILSFKSHSSSINYWPSARIRSRSLARSLPEPPFTLALSAGVIIPTNLQIRRFGSVRSLDSANYSFSADIMIRSRVDVAPWLRSIQTHRGHEYLRDNQRIYGAEMVYGAADTTPGTGHLGLDKQSAKVP